MAVAEKIILGTAQFGLNYGIASCGRPDADDVFRMLDEAFDQGVRVLDTASAYGNAYDLIGRYHASRQFKFDVITKFSLDSISHQDIRSHVEIAMQTMNVDRLDSLLYHCVADFDRHASLERTFSELKRQGVVKQIGISIYTNNQFEVAIRADGIDLIQLPFNLLDNARLRGDLILRAKAAGKIIHTRSVFLQGLFLRPSIPQYLATLEPQIKTLRKLSDWAQTSLAQLALNYVIGQPSIDGVLLGVDNLQQLSSNLSGLGMPIPKQIVEYIDAIKVDDVEFLNPSNWNQIRETWVLANPKTKTDFRSAAS